MARMRGRAPRPGRTSRHSPGEAGLLRFESSPAGGAGSEAESSVVAGESGDAATGFLLRTGQTATGCTGGLARSDL